MIHVVAREAAKADFNHGIAGVFIVEGNEPLSLEVFPQPTKARCPSLSIAKQRSQGKSTSKKLGREIRMDTVPGSCSPKTNKN